MRNDAILVSGVAGCGTTTVTANIAMAMTKFGVRTKILNGDLLTPKLHYHFGLFNKPLDKEYQYHGLKLSLGNNSVENLNKEGLHLIDVPQYGMNWYKTEKPTIVVTTPDLPSVVDTLKLLKTIPNVRGIVINKAVNDDNELSSGNIREFLGCEILGEIKRDRKIMESIKAGFPYIEMFPDDKISLTFKQIAAKLMNQDYSIINS